MQCTKKQWTYTGLVLIASLIAGSLAGIVSSVYTNRSMENYMQAISDEQILLTLSQVKPGPVPGTYEEALGAVNESRNSLAYIFASNDLSSAVSGWIYETDALGVGVVVTSDGWILLDGSALGGRSSSQVKIYVSGEWYESVDVVTDIRSSAILIKIDASGLDALAYGSSESMQDGQFVFAPGDDGGLYVSSLVNSQYTQDDFSRAEDYVNSWLLQDSLGASLPILDSSGGLIGFTATSEIAMPLYELEDFVNSVLEFSEAQYAALGAYIVDIERAVNVDVADLGTEDGFMITQIVYGSPAYDGGLRQGDIIASIGGAEVSSDFELAKALSRYIADEEVVIGLIRDGEHVEKTVTLGSYDLVY